ncbi:hypothetical protein PAMA_013828 [Pampus argenteus]
MAAIRSGLTPVCLARCFLRQTGKPSRGSPPFSDVWSHRLLQRSHLHTVFECSRPTTRTLLGRRRHGKVLWVNAVAVRHNSSQIPVETVSTAVPIADSFASPPVLDVFPPIVSADPVTMQPIMEQVVHAAPTAVEVLQAATTEPTLAELGLAGHTPVGLIQNLLEFMHVDLGLPWWGAIVVGTVIARLAVFPVLVKGHREAVKLNNVMPEMTKLSTKMTEAYRSGNQFECKFSLLFLHCIFLFSQNTDIHMCVCAFRNEAAVFHVSVNKAHTDLTLFQKKHNVNPLRGFLIPLVQAPIFISFFIALRTMATLPVPSMQSGGMLWFTDLTAADPFYILPVAVTGTVFFILELGAEGGIDNPNMKAMKNVFRIIPFIILPLTINFPTAVFTYWMTSNCFTLGQVALFRHPLIREKLRIPEKIKHPKSAMPQQDDFIESMKKAWKNAQLGQQKKNHLDFAAKGPHRQTFTHNPLQQSPPINAESGKTVSSKPKPLKDTIG